MHLKAKRAFSWAHRGVQVEHFEKNQIIETDDEDLIRVSLEEGWAEKAKAPSKAEQKTALEEQIAQLETDLIAADDTSVPGIEAEISAAKAKLADIS